MAITRLHILLFVPVYILLCSVSAGYQKTNTPITLHDEKFNFTPHQFYIADVADERKDRNAVAMLINKGTNVAYTNYTVDLKDGAVASIKKFLDHNLGHDTLLRPVMMTIKELKLTETGLPGGRISGRLAIAFSFTLQKSYQTIHLVDYTSGIKYDRPDNKPVDAEEIMRHGIQSALIYFNTWMDQQAGINPLLAKKVKVTFNDYTEKPEGDTIYYSANRPLMWSDFKDKPKAGYFEAEVFTNIGYIEQNKVENGTVNVHLIIKVDLAKSDCWVRDGGRNDYTLNHEQRHFDIEKIVAEHFKQKIKAMELPTDNFYGPINVEYLETLREATRMQKQYDAETNHGQDRQGQQQWNEKIDKELKALDVKK